LMLARSTQSDFVFFVPFVAKKGVYEFIRTHS
jgi:hypothetical protein